MISAAVASSLRVLRIRPAGRSRIVGRVALDVAHHRYSCFEAGHAKGELGKDDQGEQHEHERIPVLGGHA